MPLNFSTLVYLPNFDYFARPITVTPVAGGSYSARGIYDTDEMDVIMMDGSIFSDQQTMIYIRDVEFSVLPKQKDQIYIGPVDDIPEEGTFEVKDTSSNGGGETKVVLRKVLPAKP
jgi:hypothetical protein